MGLFDFLGLQGPNEDQKKKLEEELASNMQAAKEEPISFKLPDVGAIVPAMSNVGQGIKDTASTLANQAAMANAPVYQKESPEKIKSLEEELRQLEEQSKQYTDMFPGVGSPLETQFEEARKAYKTETPKSEEPSEEQPDTKVSTKVSTKSSISGGAPGVSSTIAKKEQKEPSLFDIASAPKKPNTQYDEALARAEEGKRLAALLSGASQLGRSVAGAGYLSDKREDFSNIGDLYADDKRIMDEALARKAREEEASVSDPTSNISKALQAEMAQLLKDTGQEIKDPSALANMSANDLKPLIASYKARRDDQRLREKADEDRRARQEDMRFKYAQLRAMNEAKAEAKKEEKKTKADNATLSRIEKAGKLVTAELQSRSAFGIAAKNRQSVENAEALLAGRMNLNDVDNRELVELARVLDRVLSQGTSTISGTKHLTPETAQQKIAGMMEFFTSKVQGSGAADFVKKYQKTLQREREVADKQIIETQKKVLAPYKDIIDHPNMQELLQQNGLPSNPFDTKAAKEELESKTERMPSAPSKATLDLINSRSDDENKKRLQELKAKYGAK